MAQVGVQGSGIQIGHDPVFGTSESATGPRASAVLLDDAGTGVAGLTPARSTTGADTTADRIDLEGQSRRR